MSDKIYKVILLGEIADGYDIEIAHEKLAIIFDIDLKKIPKLLKKPTVIRKELTHSVAAHYQAGLEKIGVLCKIHPPLETGYVESIPEAPEEDVPELTFEPEEISEEKVADEPVKEVIKFAPIEMKLDTLRVADIQMSFGAILLLFIKIALASITAMIILGGIIFLLQQAIIMIGNFI
ncbi:MAG: hypothetical protein QM487_08435 [Candidatus Marithrix sp.]